MRTQITNNQITQPVVIRSSRQALLTASTLHQCHIGAVSAQDQMMSRFILLQLEVVSGYGNPTQNREGFFCLVFVVIAAHCSIVELIVGPSRARQHASSCVWNRGRLFINKPHIQGLGLRG